MTVSVLVPFRPDAAERDRAWQFVRPLYDGWDVIVGSSPDGPFSRSAAILDAASRATGDVFIVADADVFTDHTALDDAVSHALDVGWAIPHLLLHRLSQASTEAVYGGACWRGLPLSTDNQQDRKPYQGNETGTLVVLRRDVLDRVPPDRRFKGWGSEDVAWAYALRCLEGPPWRGEADLVHLFHPPQERKSRIVGTDDNRRLLRRYEKARRNPSVMRALLDEVST